jgi:uncharacterized lipoprotein
MKLIAIAAIAVLAISLSGCGSTVPVDYSPSSTLSATGNLQVGDFRYLPSINGKYKPNEIHNTAMGQILLDKNVDIFIHNAVFLELRQVGIKMGNTDKVLSGDIKEFLIDDLGYSVDWTVEIQYFVKDASGKVIYSGDKLTKNRTAKFANAFVALNMQIKENIESLIKDPDFVKTVN